MLFDALVAAYLRRNALRWLLSAFVVAVGVALGLLAPGAAIVSHRFAHERHWAIGSSLRVVAGRRTTLLRVAAILPERVVQLDPAIVHLAV